MISPWWLLLPMAIDMYATKRTIQLHMKLYPKDDYRKLELNRLMRFAWKKFGFKKGWIIGTIGVAIIMLAVIQLSFIWNQIFWVYVGMYAITLYIHANNLQMLIQEIKRRYVKATENVKKSKEGMDAVQETIE